MTSTLEAAVLFACGAASQREVPQASRQESGLTLEGRNVTH